MKKSIVAALIITAFATSAQATNLFGDTNNNQTYNQPASHSTANGNISNVNNNNEVNVKPTINTNISNDVRNNASASVGIVNGNSNTNHNANANINGNTNTNKLENTQGQQQGQLQGQGQQQAIKNSGNSQQGQNQSTENANNSQQSVNVEGSTYEAQKRDPVATAYAPSIAPTAPCMGSTSGGIQTVGLGFSLGVTWTDDNCVLLEQVRAVNNVGEKEVAIEMLNSIPAYAEAKQRIADRKAAAK